MKSTITSIFTIILTVCLLSACAGRDPRPVDISQVGDQEKSCSTLDTEMAHIEEDILERLPDSDKSGSNAGLGVAGVFLIVPWFFMDFSKADEIEISALIQRHNHLLLLANEKECETERERIPTIEEMRRQANEAKKTDTELNSQP